MVPWGCFAGEIWIRPSNHSKIPGRTSCNKLPANSIPRIDILDNSGQVVICNIWLAYRANEVFWAESGFSVTQIEYQIRFRAKYS
jgi:hypothetical protein